VSGSTRQRASTASGEKTVVAHNLRARPIQIAKAVAAVVTFAATLTGLIFGLWPTLEPAAPPAAKGAALTNATIDLVSFRQYLDRTMQSRSPFGAAQLERPGALVGFDFNIKGYLGKDLPLRWQLIDASTHEQVHQSQDLFMTPTANEDQNSWSVWIPLPSRAGHRFFVEIQLLDEGTAAPLGRIRTDRFSTT